MSDSRWLRLVTVLLAIVGAGFAPRSVQAGELVTVSLTNGRQITGELDDQTNDQKIWLQFAAENISIRRSIPWTAIDVVRQDTSTLNKSQVLELADRPHENTTEPTAANSNSPPGVVPETSFAVEPGRMEVSFSGPVRSIQFDAEAANWDADVELDGLLVHLLPVDINGQVTPVRGTLEAELFVTRRRGFLVVPNRRGTSPERIGRWSLQVNVRQITPAGAFMQLPFENIRSEFDTDWSNLGLLHIRLVAPGHGVFESSLDAVPLRPVTPIRDTLERFGGERFLPTEQTGVSLPIGR